MANQKLNSRIEIGASVDRSVGRALSAVERGFKKVGGEIRDVEKAQKALARQRDDLRKKGRDVSALEREYDQLGSTLDALQRKQARYERTLVAGRNVGQQFRRSFRSVAIGAAAAAAAIGTVSAAGLSLAKSAAEAGDEIGSTSAMLGMSAAALQELRYAAETSDVTTAQLGKSLEMMNRQIGEAAQGMGTAKDAFIEMGLSADDLARAKPDEALAMIAERFAEIKTPADRARLAMAIFGRSGQPMINLLTQGGEGMAKMRAEARALGLVMSDDAVAGAGNFDNALRDLNMIVLGVKNTIGAALIPVFTEAIQSTKTWLLENKDAVRAAGESFTALAKAAIPVIGKIVSGLGRVGAAVARGADALQGMLGGWDNLGIAIGAVLAAGPAIGILKLVSLVGSLGIALGRLVGVGPLVAGSIRGIGAALLFNPIGLAVTAIAGGALLIWKYWEPIKAQFNKLVAQLSGEFEVLKRQVGAVVDWFRDAGAGIADRWGVFRDRMVGIIDAVIARFELAVEKIGAAVAKIKEAGSAAVEVGGQVVSGSAARRGAARIGAFLTGRDDPGPLQRRALGGSFRPGPLQVGERGSELMFPDVGGFIAHHGQVRRLEGMARSAARNFERMSPSAGRAAPARDRRPVPVNITINQAPGQDPRAVALEVERLLRRRGGELFDGVMA